MFENVLGQNITTRLIEDIKANKLPPSILFFGPNSSGKFTTALELARIVSCLKKGEWGCDCLSCQKHKNFASSDLLVLGSRDYILEIKASRETLLKNKTNNSLFLFLRSVRKLTCRFDARLWDTDEQRFLKAAPIISELEELLSQLFIFEVENFDDNKLKKLIDSIVTKTIKLEEDCAYDSIPINQVRKASSWIRLMPSGAKKVLIIENADKMQEGARNAFLKILEEPPAYVLFILTTEKKSAIMPTILSRVRPYKFEERSDEKFAGVISRIFKGNVSPENKFGNFNLLKNFLYSFLPVDFYTIQKNAVLFYEFIFSLMLQENKPLPNSLFNSVNKFKSKNNIETQNLNISKIVNELNKCKPHSVFVLFLNCLLFFLHNSLRENNGDNLSAIETESYFKITKLIKNAETSTDIFNLSPQAILESLAVKIKDVF